MVVASSLGYTFIRAKEIATAVPAFSFLYSVFRLKNKTYKKQ